MKKIFILTGEPSGDKLASTVIKSLKMENNKIEYLSVGGTHLKSLGIKTIFDLKEITYLGFISVLFNIFKIKAKINKTVEEIKSVASINPLNSVATAAAPIPVPGELT